MQERKTANNQIWMAYAAILAAAALWGIIGLWNRSLMAGCCRNMASCLIKLDRCDEAAEALNNARRVYPQVVNMEAVEKVTVSNVVACANSLGLHTTYFLKGGSQ